MRKRKRTFKQHLKRGFLVFRIYLCDFTEYLLPALKPDDK